MERTAEERLADLEARVAALEDGAHGRSARAGAAARPPEDVFFALNALREQVTGRGGVVFAGIVRGEGEENGLEWQQGLPVERLEGADWSRHAASLDALGNPVRLQLLHAVWTAPAPSPNWPSAPTSAPPARSTTTSTCSPRPDGSPPSGAATTRSPRNASSPCSPS